MAARNTLHNNHGFSPNQLVFSFNPQLPNIGEDSPSALEKVTPSQIVANNLTALWKSREEFIKADANERIRRALSQSIRKTEDEHVDIGNYVYYKRDGEDKWRGPARVIGKDGKVNLLRHGGQILRAHICRVKGMVDQRTDPAKEVNGHDESETKIEKPTRIETTKDEEGEDDEDECDENSNANSGIEGVTRVDRGSEPEERKVIPKVG